MKNYQLHDFVEDYPQQDDPDIQFKTAQRKEFSELASSSTKLEKVGRFFKHQEFFLRYLRNNDRILNIQETGTGKSGSIINAAEYYKRSGENIKRVYIIQPGPATASDFRNQIQKLSDPEEYTNDKIKYANNKASVSNNLTRLIKEWYSIETYQQFSKRPFNDKLIEEEYSDCLFFFDEAHKLKNLDDGKGKEIGEEETKKVYQYLWKVCHIAKRSKIVLATATPMINSTFDFVPLLNLLLPMDFQLPTNVPTDFYDHTTLNQLEPYFRGKITFIKFLGSNINVKNEGETMEYTHEITLPTKKKGQPLLPTVKKIENGFILDVHSPPYKSQPLVPSKVVKFKSAIKITQLEMMEPQLSGYLKSKKGKKSFFSSERQSSVFVFPNGEYGTKGFESYTEKDQYGEYAFSEGENNLKKYINEQNLELGMSNLRLFSSKFHFYLTKELERSEHEHPGNSFCYIEFVNASGASLLGMILTIFGFEEYQSNFPAFDIRTKEITIRKGKRFALLTGKQNNIQETLNLFNSYENRHGEYIQMLIASELARDGINVKNVIRGYIMTPTWHEAGMYQALSRFIRADSHDYLDNQVEVEIYRLASVVPNSTLKSNIDIKLYLDSEEKDIKNKIKLKEMKECAFDGYNNYDRNVSGGETIDLWNGPSPPKKSEYIYNTYYLYYVEDLIKEVKSKIIRIIQKNIIILYSKLKEEMNAIDYVFNTALEELIFGQEIISNYQNTIFYTLKFNKDIIYMKRENLYDLKEESTENNLYLDNKYPILRKVSEIKNNDKRLNDFYEMFSDSSSEEIKNYYVEKQDQMLFQKLLEISLINYRNNRTNNIDEIIMNLFSNYILITKKPTGYYSYAEEAISKESTKKQGRKRGENSKAGFKDTDLEKSEPGFSEETVIVHFYQPTEETAFSVNTIFETENRKIKILKEDDFVDTDIIENFVYNFMFTQMYKKIMKPFKEAKYYGSYIQRGDKGTSILEKEKNFFRIIDNTQENSRGKVCTSFDTDFISDILEHLDLDKEYSEVRRKKPVICPILLKLFKRHNLLFESL